jgi:hypothetical protein
MFNCHPRSEVPFYSWKEVSLALGFTALILGINFCAVFNSSSAFVKSRLCLLIFQTFNPLHAFPAFLIMTFFFHYFELEVLQDVTVT